ncbi:MAG: pyridoxal-phosphate dependent enzyme, partial [Candidatus Rokubacteria bacterium]|nr:pyridoxal-phosphate dependent enzyme [Candidatus Rokubacteria bacterium]
ASGSLYVKIWKGLQELAKLWLIDSVHTKMSGAQAAGCSPIVSAWEKGQREVEPVEVGETIAESIAAGAPALGWRCLSAIAETGGAAASATDEEILAARSLLARTTGVFCEPSAAA